MDYLDLLTEALNLSATLHTAQQKEKLKERVISALHNGMIDTHDAEEINQIADLKMFD